MKHLLTAAMPRDEAIALLDLAEDMHQIQDRELKKLPALRGRTVVNLFFEDSTRTRSSFEIAGKWLSADVINVSGKGSSASKGESLRDTGLTIAAMGVDVAAVSADSAEQLADHQRQLGEPMAFPMYWGLTVQQMQGLGLYVSDPRSPTETDHPFAEPGLFVVNAEGALQVVDISNNPFVRPDLKTLVRGLVWIRDPENHYPIRGTHPYP